MSPSKTSTAIRRKSHLRKIPPPPEPAEIYPAPHLSNIDLLALVRGKTFFTANHKGNLMPPASPQVGFFCDDTRYLSQLDLVINGHPPVPLSFTTEGGYGARIDMAVKEELKTDGLDLPVNAVHLHREQLLEADVLYDVVHFESYYRKPIKLTVEISYDADFMDIFQVRGVLRGKSGQHYAPIADHDRMQFVYQGLDHRIRTTSICFVPAPVGIEGKTARWEMELEPSGKARITTTIHAHSERHQSLPDGGDSAKMAVERSAARAAQRDDLHDQVRTLRYRYEHWRKDCTHFYSNNRIFDNMLSVSTEDFHSLRIPSNSGTAVAAGVPWFAALFGRDSLIASLQTLILNPCLAEGTLRVLASYQARETRDDRDEEPGKIPHELRSGEMTATGEVAFGKNYGSVDATPLFIILLAEYYRWTGDRGLVKDLAGNLQRAVQWVLCTSQKDKDGLIDYCRKTPKGLFNQGWKDSGDSMLHTDGHVAQPPIALIEAQGYAVRALSDAAELLHDLGARPLAEKALKGAERIRPLIDSMFWMEEKNYYAMALDRDKQPLDVIGSNPGHLLFAGAISAERAQKVVTTLLDDSMFSGWGIRTLSSRESTYNPMSYHRGSVWPHDNSLIAYGMAHYGFKREVSKIYTALYEAALHFRDYRLPELFCGIQRREHDDPVQYPVSCSLQAWASGTPLLLLDALLGLRPIASRRELRIINPHLPEFVSFLRVENLRVANSRVILEFQRQGARTFCNVVDVEGEPIAISIDFR